MRHANKTLPVVFILVIFVLSIPGASGAYTYKDNEDAGHDRTSQMQGKLSEKLKNDIVDKRHLSEFTVGGGDFLGDEWQNSWDVGAMYSFYFNNTFGVGAAYTYTPIRADGRGSFGRSLKTHNAHITYGDLVLNNDTAFRAGSTIISCDLYLTVGAGMMEINRKWQPLGVVGGGLRVYTPIDWLAVRFDVNSYIHPTPNPTGDTINADMAMNLGFSFLFPPIKNPYHSSGQKLEDEKSCECDKD
jgi:outer membrane beta-barrel protein